MKETILHWHILETPRITNATTQQPFIFEIHALYLSTPQAIIDERGLLKRALKNALLLPSSVTLHFIYANARESPRSHRKNISTF